MTPSLKIPFIFLFLILGAFHGISQTHTYDQIIRGKTVGQLIIEVKSNDDNLKIKVESDVKVNFLFLKTEVEYDGKASYKAGKLMHAHIKICRDGELHQEGETTYGNHHYKAVIDGKRKLIPTERIEFSSLLLYVKEPKGIKEVYAEVDGIFNPIEYKDNGTYELKLTGAKNNFYTYRNGKLVEAKLDHWIAPIHLKLRE